jgi:uncharacterized protein (TIGR03067 family)
MTGGGKGKSDSFDPAKLIGTWKFLEGTKDGEKLPEEQLKQQEVVITKNTLTLKNPAGDFVMKYEIDAKKSPLGIKLEITDGPVGVGMISDGILELKGEEFRICYAAMGGERPNAFESKPGSGNNLFKLKRAK